MAVRSTGVVACAEQKNGSGNGADASFASPLPGDAAVCRVTLTNPGLYPGCVPMNNEWTKHSQRHPRGPVAPPHPRISIDFSDERKKCRPRITPL